MSPKEPGWYQSPDDPTDIERWYTGAEWSEYTRPSEVTAPVDSVTAEPSADVASDADTAATTESDTEASNPSDESSLTAPTKVNPAVSGAATPEPIPNSAPNSAAPNPAMPSPAMPGPAMPNPTPMQPPPAPAASVAPTAIAPTVTGPPAPAPGSASGSASDDGRAAVAQAMAFGRSWMDRLIAMGNANESGVDRNVGVMTWLPLFGPAVWIAYLFTGRNWSSVGRGHVIGSINLTMTVLFVHLMVAGSFFAGQVWVGLGVVLLLVGGALFGLVVWFLSQRYGQSLGHWIWLGVIVVLALLSIVADPGLISLYGAVMGGFLIATTVTNIVRARLGMARTYLAFPVVPLLSER